MYHTCRALVLQFVAHTDKTTLLRLYTREQGKVWAAVSGLHGRKSGAKSALFSPLAPLQVTLQDKGGHLRIQEAGVIATYNSIATHPGKRSMAFFLAELLVHSLPDHDTDEALFDFLYNKVQILEQTSFNPDFHLHLMMHLTQYLGIYPNLDVEGAFFDLEGGVCRMLRPNHPHYLSPEDTELFCRLCVVEDSADLALTRQKRQALLGHLLEYYRLHIPYFGQLRSVSVLQELFD